MAHATKAKKQRTTLRQATSSPQPLCVVPVHRAVVDRPIKLVAHPYDEVLRKETHHLTINAARVYAIAQYPDGTRYHIVYRDKYHTQRIQKFTRTISETTTKVKIRAHIASINVREDFSNDRIIIKKRNGAMQVIGRPAKHMAYASAIVNEFQGFDARGKAVYSDGEIIKGFKLHPSEAFTLGIEQDISKIERCKVLELEARKLRVELMPPAERDLYNLMMAHRDALAIYKTRIVENELPVCASGLESCTSLFDVHTFPSLF